jgi:hypothetical protein
MKVVMAEALLGQPQSLGLKLFVIAFASIADFSAWHAVSPTDRNAKQSTKVTTAGGGANPKREECSI